jgi:hypothetical protein
MKRFISLLILMTIIAMTFTGCLLGHTVEKARETAYGVVDKTLNTDNVIYNYEWFKKQYNVYLAVQKKVTQAQNAATKFEKSAGERDKWTFEDKNEYARLTSIVDGFTYQAEDIKAEYNAKSQMVNRSIFKTGDLPESIE